jgi:pimeloyl-ACP methyl ester carboxylesterase
VVREKCVSRQWVLLRGLVREQGHWGPFTQQLQDADPSSEVLGIDLPGAGIYHRLSSPLTVNGIAEFVHSHLGPKPEQRYVVAISLGGMVAAEMAQIHPECMDGLVIINSSFNNLSPFYHRLQLESYLHIFRAAVAKSLEKRELAILEMLSHRPDIEDIAKEWAIIAKERPVSPLTFIKQLFAASNYELPEKKPDMPVLVLTSEGDRMVNPLCSKKLAATWNVPIEVHPTSGHELCLDNPEWVVENLLRFFAVKQN